MPIKVIGKSILGDLGFCQVPSKMGDHFEKQLQKIENCIPISKIVMTSMTGSEEVEHTGGAYYPKIRKIYSDNEYLFNPRTIYLYCKKGEDKFRPGCDFIVWDSNQSDIVATTFSREAPILAFKASNGMKALGVILRPSLMKYGDYLFSTIKEALGENITVTLVTCNHYEYPEGSIPSIVLKLAYKYDMKSTVYWDSEKNPECYHRGEKGNHIVALW